VLAISAVDCALHRSEILQNGKIAIVVEVPESKPADRAEWPIKFVAQRWLNKCGKVSAMVKSRKAIINVRKKLTFHFCCYDHD
jgi:hypothetical protein